MLHLIRELRGVQGPRGKADDRSLRLRAHFTVNSYFVYMLASQRNGTLYIGVTNDLVRRVYEHKNDITGGFTSIYNVKQLVWFDQTPDITVAIAREKRMKKWPRAWKINLIEAQNPQWRDLYPTLIA